MTQTFAENPLAADHYTRQEWPSKRGSREEFVERFGEERAQRFTQAYWAMDPIADALYTSGNKSKASCQTCARHLRGARRTKTPCLRLRR
ncbi:hypothetical protein [Corynebacterium aquatimens]|uniref:hypothetical protein n=1 Tax=Corynebacterium aquatimens TaxID=1190508 RepID=UPI00253FBC0F|nr:hypothetical protein [Corynebacterium aquatimens]